MSLGDFRWLRSEVRLEAIVEVGLVGSAVQSGSHEHVELAAFQERIKERPEELKIVRSVGYRGGAGGWRGYELLVLGLVGCGVCGYRRVQSR